MSGSDSAKGNPATKRIGNATHKACRQRSRLRGEKRKQERIKLAEQRAAMNRELRSEGKPTAWERACARRAARRNAISRQGS